MQAKQKHYYTAEEYLSKQRWFTPHMAANQIAPTEAIYICGAAHAASFDWRSQV